MIKELLQEGFALKRKGYYKHAIEVFYKALEKDNSSTELLLEIADLYYLMHNEEKALSYIELILNKEPEHIASLKLLKQIFVDKNAWAEAEQTAKNIYCISHNINDLIEIFKLLNKQGKYDEIFEYNVDTPNEIIYLEQAQAKFNQKDFDASEVLLNKAIKLNPNFQKALLLLGKIFYAQNKKDCCVQIMQKLIPDEKNAELLNFTGLINTYLEKYKEAKKNFLDAIKLDNYCPIYYFNLANVYLKQGNNLSAKKYYNLAISLEPENPNYHFALANLYYSEGHYKKALEELDDKLFEAQILKVIILYNTGYLALAKKELDVLLKEHTDNKIIQEYKILIYKELGLN